MGKLELSEFELSNQVNESVSGTAVLDDQVVFLRAFPSGRAAPVAMRVEEELYQALAELQSFTPHIAQLLKRVRTREPEWAADVQTASADPEAVERAIDEANFRSTDRITSLLIESSPQSLYSDADSLSEDEVLQVIFQVLWTLVVLNHFGIRHGQLHTENILLVRQPYEAAYVLDPESAEYYQLDTDVFIKIGNWLWGGIYARDEGFDRPAGEPVLRFSPIDTAFSAECREYSSCGRNDKIDLHRFIVTLPIEVFRERGYDRVVAIAEYAVHPDLWTEYLCAGKYAAADCEVQYNSDAECTGPWEPPDCLVKPPEELLRHPVFESLVRSRATAEPKGPVYGLWRDEQQAADWEGQAPEPQLASGRVCSLRKIYPNRYTIEELRELAKQAQLPYWAEMSYTQLCAELGKQLID